MFRHRLWILSVAIVAGSAIAADPPDRPHPPADAPDSGDKRTGQNLSPLSGLFGERSELLTRGNGMRMGRFDRNGNFIPNAGSTGLHQPPQSGPFGAVLPVNEVTRENRAVYEHRSGRLIRGTLVTNPKGVFVPEIGSTLLDLKKDYVIEKADRRVYNLRETVRPSPVAPNPPEVGQPAGWKLMPFREAYPKDPKRANPWFARVIGEVMELGHLSDEGEFMPDYGLPVFPYVKSKDWAILNDHFQDGTQRSMYYTLPKDGKDSEDVYEYRSGRLIKGTLHKTGNFVPEIGSKVLDFKDYDPSLAKGNRIYNLPGVLRKAK